MTDRTKIKIPAIVALCAVSLMSATVPVAADSQTNSLEITSASVNDRQIPIRGRKVNLGSSPEHVTFLFPPDTNSQPPVRVRFKLDGYDSKWHDAPDAMTLTIRFFNASGDQVSGQHIFGVNGESAGWTGSLRTSSLTHRRESLVAPPQSTRFMAVISSAGPAASVGVYVVANLTIHKANGDATPTLLLASPSDTELDERTNPILSGWVRDGLHKSMARIVSIGQMTPPHAFAILDDDRTSHAEWHNLLTVSPQISPGDHLLIEWNEMYSIGDGFVTAAHYENLPEGSYIFHVAESDIFGRPTGNESYMNVVVSPKFWRATWFWFVVLVLMTMLAIGSWRYVLWNRMHHELAVLKNQQALERERLRIAHDIHDGLGARVTQISMVSSRAQDNQSFPEMARVEFERISKMSRELVSALYETVWAVDPENDNLDELGNYLCQIVNQLCEQAQFRCRFYVVDLPGDVQVSSQTRHNISMAVQEAVHNVIKHAGVAEVTIDIKFTNDMLAITVRDDGSGFMPVGDSGGNGLINMKKRLSDIGGSCIIESQLGKGTTIQMSVKIKSSGRHPAKNHSRATNE